MVSWSSWFAVLQKLESSLLARTVLFSSSSSVPLFMLHNCVTDVNWSEVKMSCSFNRVLMSRNRQFKLFMTEDRRTHLKAGKPKSTNVLMSFVIFKKYGRKRGSLLSPLLKSCHSDENNWLSLQTKAFGIVSIFKRIFRLRLQSDTHFTGE